MKAGGRIRFAIVALLLLVPAGCRSRNQDLLENELRHREGLYREALDEQRKAECRIDSLQREVETLRQGGPKIPPEQAALAGGVKRITLGRSTGGFDKDNCPGDELLQVIVEPRDCDDHVIKAPGQLQVFALEITPQGLKLPLSSWDISPEQLRSSWKPGLLSTGYTLNLPWQNFPHTDTVRVVVRLIVADGRTYEADKDVRVRIVAGAPSRPPDVNAGPMLPPTSPPPLPLETIPPPRPLPNPAPMPSADPFLVPSGRTTQGDYRAARPATAWTPPTLQGTVRIGRPSPLPEP